MRTGEWQYVIPGRKIWVGHDKWVLDWYLRKTEAQPSDIRFGSEPEDDQEVAE